MGAYYHRHESVEKDLNPDEFLKKRRLEKHLGYNISNKEWNEVNQKPVVKANPMKEGLQGAVEPLLGEDGKKKKKRRTEDGGRSQTGMVPDKYQSSLRDTGQSI